jgi:[ribosomal protein S5]-alanine N-acetyltransferase
LWGAPDVVIETTRLRMRPLRDGDLTDLVTLAGNWRVARWLATMPHPYTEANGREWISWVQQDHATGRPRRFAIALKGADRLIGGIGLDGSTGDESEEPALGYWLGEPHWGNGYAREAVAAVIGYGLRTLGMETIRAYTDPSNLASQKVLLHCGLEQVGEIDLIRPTRNGARRAPLFRISRRPVSMDRAGSAGDAVSREIPDRVG